MAFENKRKPSRKPKKRKNKINLVFDETKRREFLTGFHKRKVQRKKYAKEQFEKELKEEKKRIKAEARESYKKLVVSHRPIPELEDLASEQYEDDDVTVKVVELSASDIAARSNWIGINQPLYDKDNESEEEEEIKEEVPGMSLKEAPQKKAKKEKGTETVKFRTEKDVKKVLKKQATKTVKKSKVFQMKNKLERSKQKKRSLETKKQKMKFNNKKEKRKKGGRNTRQNVST